MGKRIRKSEDEEGQHQDVMEVEMSATPDPAKKTRAGGRPRLRSSCKCEKKPKTSGRVEVCVAKFPRRDLSRKRRTTPVKGTSPNVSISSTSAKQTVTGKHSTKPKKKPVTATSTSVGTDPVPIICQRSLRQDSKSLPQELIHEKRSPRKPPTSN